VVEPRNPLEEVLNNVCKLGVTGTHRDNAILDAQLDTLRRIIEYPKVVEVHHGDCVGVDAAAHRMAVAARRFVHVHPPTNPKLRAFCDVRFDWERPLLTRYPPLGYIERDHVIVDSVDTLVAVPVDGVIHEVCHHGTCVTVRYGWKRGRPVIVIQPNGGLILATRSR
jgi:hypothetical protein